MNTGSGTTLTNPSVEKGDGAGALLLSLPELGVNKFGAAAGATTAGATGFAFSNGLHVNHFDDKSANIASSLPLYFVHQCSSNETQTLRSTRWVCCTSSPTTQTFQLPFPDVRKENFQQNV